MIRIERIDLAGARDALPTGPQEELAALGFRPVAAHTVAKPVGPVISYLHEDGLVAAEFASVAGPVVWLFSLLEDGTVHETKGPSERRTPKTPGLVVETVDGDLSDRLDAHRARMADLELVVMSPEVVAGLQAYFAHLAKGTLASGCLGPLLLMWPFFPLILAMALQWRTGMLLFGGICFVWSLVVTVRVYAAAAGGEDAMAFSERVFGSAAARLVPNWRLAPSDIAALADGVAEGEVPEVAPPVGRELEALGFGAHRRHTVTSMFGATPIGVLVGSMVSDGGTTVLHSYEMEGLGSVRLERVFHSVGTDGTVIETVVEPTKLDRPDERAGHESVAVAEVAVAAVRHAERIGGREVVPLDASLVSGLAQRGLDVRNSSPAVRGRYALLGAGLVAWFGLVLADIGIPQDDATLQVGFVVLIAVFWLTRKLSPPWLMAVGRALGGGAKPMTVEGLRALADDRATETDKRSKRSRAGAKMMLALLGLMVAALIGSFGLIWYRPFAATEGLVMVQRDIAVGQVISWRDVRAEPGAVDILGGEGTFASVDAVVGKTAQAPLEKWEVVHASRLSDASGAAALLPEGYVEATLAADRSLFRVGDRIDLWSPDGCALGQDLPVVSVASSGVGVGLPAALKGVDLGEAVPLFRSTGDVDTVDVRCEVSP